MKSRSDDRERSELTDKQEPLDLDEELEWFRVMSFSFGDITSSRLEKWLQEIELLREEVEENKATISLFKKAEMDRLQNNISENIFEASLENKT